jgi:glycosyltransferase involved in cell wall biosynthesis
MSVSRFYSSLETQLLGHTKHDSVVSRPRSMRNGFTVIVIVPAYNEAQNIARTLRTLPSFVDHVVLVDDASEDNTLEQARAVADPRVDVISHSHNRGVGAALTTGYARSAARTTHPQDVFAVMAGDGQMDAADLGRLIDPIVHGDADYVKGNRFTAPDIEAVMPRGRRIGGLFFSFWTSMAIGQPITDSQCGYTALARGACLRLDLERLWPRYGYPNDLLGQLAARKMRIVEVPVRPVYGSETSGLKLRHLPTIAALVARAWIRRRRG